MLSHIYKHWKKYVFSLVLSIVILGGAYGLTKYRPRLVPIEKNNQQGDNAVEEYGFELEVTSEKSTNETEDVGQIFLDGPQDKLNVHLKSFLGVDTNFIMKVFYNYKEVAFEVVNNEETTAGIGYVAELLDDGEIDIPIMLANNVHKKTDNDSLMVSIFFRPDVHTKDLEGTTNFHGGSFVYDLIYKEEQPKQFIPIINFNSFTVPRTIVTDIFPNSISEGLIINNELNIEMYAENVPLPPLNLQVKRNEEIELAYVVSDPLGGMNDNFVIISLLGWEQWEMSGQRYLPVKTLFDYTLLDSFTFKAPEQVGAYEFVAVMIPVRNAFALSKQDSQKENTYPSYRFTIEVVD